MNAADFSVGNDPGPPRLLLSALGHKFGEVIRSRIERLIGTENFTLHGLKGAGASLCDLAKIRVYLKQSEDLAKCRAVCERRFGAVPAIYAVAGICRPELLVEIEGVAFSRYSRA